MIGQEIAHFRIEAALGSLGTGPVWKACDLEGGRDVAIKTLDARSFREACRAAHLEHRNIVRTLDTEATGEGGFLVMELPAGESLRARLARGAVEPRAAMEIGAQICEALAYAHAGRIAHGGLNPGTILIGPDDTVQLFDFGLGSGDARADVQAVGAMLKEMLSGGSMGFAGALQLEKLISQCRSQQPDAAAEVAQELRRLLLGTPEKATVVTRQIPQMDALKHRQNHVMGQLGVAFVVMALAVGLGLLGSRWTSAPRETDLWMTLRGTLGVSTAGEWTQVAQTLLERYDRGENLNRAIKALNRAIELDGGNAMAYSELAAAYVYRGVERQNPQDLKDALPAALRGVQLNPSLSRTHAALGTVRLELDQAQMARTAFEKALKLAPANKAGRIGMARVLETEGRFAEAEALFRKVAAESAGDWNPRYEFGVFLYRRGQAEAAVAMLKEARELAGDSVPVLRNMSAALLVLGRRDEAAKVLEQALEIRPSAELHVIMARLRAGRGRFDDALAEMKLAMAEDPNNPANWEGLGDARRWMGDRSAAAAYKRAIELARNELVKTPGDLDVRANLALYLAKSGNLGGAEAELGRLLAAGAPPPRTMYAAAVASELVGDRGRAMGWLSKAMENSHAVRTIRTDPDLAGLRNDPRFKTVDPRPAHPSKAVESVG